MLRLDRLVADALGQRLAAEFRRTGERGFVAP
jgi:hypothetical protein